MNSVQVLSFERDDSGKPAVFHGTVAGREKTMTLRQLIAAIELTLREGPPAEYPTFNGPAPAERNDAL